MIYGHHIAPEPPTPGCSYVARIAFAYGEREYKIGEDFDWRALGLVESMARDLWVSGQLAVKPASSSAVPPKKKAG